MKPLGFAVSDDMLYRFLMAPPASDSFSDLFLKLREQCIHLDTTICSLRDNYTNDKRKDLLSGIDKLLDDLYYIKDLLCVGRSYLSSFVTRKLLGLLVVPIVVPLMQLEKTAGVKMSAVTSLYLLSRLLQVVDNKEILDSVASLVLYPHTALSSVPVSEADFDSSQIKLSFKHVNNIEQALDSSLKSQEPGKGKSVGTLLGNKLSSHHVLSCQWNDAQERVGILSYIFSDNQGLLLASLMLLLVLAESHDLDSELASVFGFTQTKSESDDTAMLKLFDGSLLMQCMPQILNALLNLLQSTPSSLALTQWHAGWFLLKLINLQRSSFNHQELHLFNINTRLNVSFQIARERLLTELNGHWFDHIPDTFKKEWTSCKKALEESSRNKDPFFILQLAYHRSSSDGDEIDDWEKMADAVKIFVLHVLLKAYVVKGSLPNDHLRTFGSSSLTSPRNSHASDGSSANFGSLVPLGSGVACKIAFSKLGVRDIYMIPVAKGLSGKLLLVEKLSFHSCSGVVLAVAPLAGLTPKKDEKHATWLHLCMRDFSPKISGKRSNLNSSTHENVARWTLGFSDAGACEAARLLIYEETCKQRSFIESLLAPFLYDNYLNEEAD